MLKVDGRCNIAGAKLQPILNLHNVYFYECLLVMNLNQEEYNELSSLEEKIELNKSRLENLQSMPLTESYGVANSFEYQDALTLFEEELESAEIELDFWEEDRYLKNLFESSGL